MAPGTEFALDFCAGIGPLQLGVVLVRFPFSMDNNVQGEFKNEQTYIKQDKGIP